jgi:hypothetical protein
MDTKQSLPEDYDKPVAYDANGQPLYAHPISTQTQSNDQQPQVVHLMRSTEPEKQTISELTKRKHDESCRIYHDLNLSEGEYIILSVRRHPIGLLAPMLLGLLLIILTGVLFINVVLVFDIFKFANFSISSSVITIPSLVFMGLILLGMYVIYYVYQNNRFYLTNESVIQEVQLSLFSKFEQTVSLSNIEDASFSQNGIIQRIFNYGSIRLSTEGEETTYRFSYVYNPKETIATLNNAVESFKNGRAVDPNC